MADANLLKMLQALALNQSRKKPGRPRVPTLPPLVALLREYFTDPFKPRLRSNSFHVWVYLLTLCPEAPRLVSASYRELRRVTGLTSNRAVQQALRELEHFGYLQSKNYPTAPSRPQTYQLPEHVGTAAKPLLETLRLRLQSFKPRRPRTRRPESEKRGEELNPEHTESTEKEEAPGVRHQALDSEIKNPDTSTPS
jgi:DNA-binding HxlR family transcriptional regulator